MKGFNEGSIWEKTDIIDLPFLPFDGDKQVTSKMINESAKYIKRVKNRSFRETNFINNFEDERRFVFYQSDTLIGLDISTIDISSLTYLDQFFFLLKMYPMVMINSFIPEESMKKIALQSYCLDHNYILPVFGAIPFFDKALSGSYYTEDVIKLFMGEKKEIKVKDCVIKYDENSIKELKIRFPQFCIKNDKISFQPQVTWLGVADRHIEELLIYLFNENVEKFNLKEVCKQYSVEESKLSLYIEKSMLFYKINDYEVIFRLQRNNIYWGFICNLASQFEKEMIERNAICYDIKIDESIGTIKKIDEKIYHKLGNLFNTYDSFSYKMFSNIKRLLDTRKYSNILVIDNGNMNGIISMLQGIGMQDALYEIVDYYSVAVKYPNVNYNKLEGQSVLVITDVINTGKLIKSTLDFLINLNCSEIGIFSFIVSQELDINDIIRKKNIDFSYFTEKELNKIDEILDKEYLTRFENDRDLTFKLLWGDIGTNVSLEKIQEPYFYHTDNDKHYKNYYSYDFGLLGDISINSYIYQKMKRLLFDRELILIHKKYFSIQDLIKNIIKTENMDQNTQIKEIDETIISLPKIIEEFEYKNVLFIIPLKLTNNKNIKKFTDVNKIESVKFLDVVGCEVYFLDNDKILCENYKEKSCIFSSKLKRYVSASDNPRIECLK